LWIICVGYIKSAAYRKFQARWRKQASGVLGDCITLAGKVYASYLAFRERSAP